MGNSVGNRGIINYLSTVLLTSCALPDYSVMDRCARFFFKKIFPETIGLAAKIQAGHKTLMDYPVEMR